MSREFSVRVSEELAGWVRRQGSPQDVLEMLAVQTARGRLRVGVPDPGPGPERLTIRFPKSGLPKLRRLTRSRKNLAAFRKLIAAGYVAQALPAPIRVARREFPAPVVQAQMVRRELPERVSSASTDLMALSPLERLKRQGFKIYEEAGISVVSSVQNRSAGNSGAWRADSERQALLRFLFWPVVR